jgi:hypothetical protein
MRRAVILFLVALLFATGLMPRLRKAIRFIDNSN